MKRISLGILFSAALIFTGCKNENKNAQDQVQEDMNQVTDTTSTMTSTAEEVQEITVNLESKSNSDVTGTAVFTEENGEVTLEATINGLAEGTHAIHLHQNADCSAEDGSSAGGHWNPTNEPHGEWGDEAGYHKGDIGNFEVGADGTGTITFSTDEWCIGCDEADRYDIAGTAVIVHEGVDDYTSQPSGAAGTRVACAGVVQ